MCVSIQDYFCTPGYLWLYQTGENNTYHNKKENTLFYTETIILVCCLTAHLWIKITCKKRPRDMFDVKCNKSVVAQCVRWTIRMPLIVIKKAREEGKAAPSSTLYDTSTVCPTMLSGLASSPNHSTTEWLHSLWSRCAPISLCYKLCLHTVSADHLLAQHCPLKAEMTEHGGGGGVRLWGVELVCSLHSRRDRPASRPILKLFLFLCQMRKKGEGNGVWVWEKMVSLCWSV